MTLYIHPDRLQALGEQVDGRPSFALDFASGFYRDAECLRRLVGLFAGLCHSPSQLEKESAFLEMFSLLAGRHALAKPQDMPAGGEKGRVQRLVELLHARLGERLSLEDLARELACTPFHLIRCFKKAQGLTPFAYLLRLRLEQARALIRRGRPLTAVALETGFSDQSHLTRKFKYFYGITPGEYRRQSLHD